MARCWWLLVWLAVGSAGWGCAGTGCWRKNGSWNGENLRGAVLGLQQGQVDVQAGNGGSDSRAARHGCGGRGFAAGDCASDACGEKPMQAKSWTNVESVGAGDTERDSKRAAEQSPEQLIAGGEDVAQQQQMQQLQQQG